MQGTVIDSGTAVSIGFLVMVIGAVVRITILLTQIRTELALHRDTPKQIQTIASDVSSTKRRVTDLEDDVNNLWAFAVAEDPKMLFGRLRRGPRSKPHGESEE